MELLQFFLFTHGDFYILGKPRRTIDRRVISIQLLSYEKKIIIIKNFFGLEPTRRHVLLLPGTACRWRNRSFAYTQKPAASRFLHTERMYLFYFFFRSAKQIEKLTFQVSNLFRDCHSGSARKSQGTVTFGDSGRFFFSFSIYYHAQCVTLNIQIYILTIICFFFWNCKKRKNFPFPAGKSSGITDENISTQIATRNWKKNLSVLRAIEFAIKYLESLKLPRSTKKKL